MLLTKEREEIALKKFSLIVPVLNGQVSQVSLATFYRYLARNLHPASPAQTGGEDKEIKRFAHQWVNGLWQGVNHDATPSKISSEPPWTTLQSHPA